MRAPLSYVAEAGVSVGTSAVVAGCLAPWWPALDLLNHFRPFMVAGAALLLALSLALRSGRLVTSSAALLFVTLVLMIAPDLVYRAQTQEAPPPRLRVATINTWVRTGQVDTIRDFIEHAGADIVMLQEVGRTDRTALLAQLAPLYPYIHYDKNARFGPALLAKRPWTEVGLIPTGRGRPLAVWARFEPKDGREFVAASVHTANPFEWDDQPQDIDQLIAFTRRQTAPVILGGDFNLTPFSWKLVKLSQLAELKWAQTFSASWPANRLVPFVLLDHVLLSEGVALLDAKTGPQVGSDHLPVVADLALVTGRRPP